MNTLNYEEAALFNLFASLDKTETLEWLHSSVMDNSSAEDELLRSLIGKLEKLDESQYAELYDRIPLDTGY